jgi:hypothetical protein
VIIERRVFQAKVGQSAAVVAKFKEFGELSKQQNLRPSPRIYTDYLSGHTDRVAVEWEMESVGSFEQMIGTLMGNPEAMRAYEQWYAGVVPLIEGAVVELWSREL